MLRSPSTPRCRSCILGTALCAAREMSCRRHKSRVGKASIPKQATANFKTGHQGSKQASTRRSVHRNRSEIKNWVRAYARPWMSSAGIQGATSLSTSLGRRQHNTIAAKRPLCVRPWRHWHARPGDETSWRLVPVVFAVVNDPWRRATCRAWQAPKSPSIQNNDAELSTICPRRSRGLTVFVLDLFF